ncbi:MAG: LytTR family DNA-binding domain-containing protein [Bacteroidetes bacterium]|nr:LytTR family DNA-binding domain-containing protein [Bacteroidota bacterium]
MQKAILIDDEKNSRESLRKKIETHCPDVQILAECANGLEGLDAIERHAPDIVFLDIEMPHMNGFNMLQQVTKRNFELIFTTAFNQYAINAIRYSALDYLVKPVDVAELVLAVERSRKKKNETDTSRQLEILSGYLSQQQAKPDKIAVSVSTGLEIITVANIIYLEATGNYTHIYMKDEKPLLASRTLKEFEDILPPSFFYRIHNAILVNVSYIKKYNRGDSGQVLLTNGVLLDVARRRKDELLQLIQKLATRI